MAKADYELDLSVLCGKKIVGVYGYGSSEYGEGEDRVFKITRIELEGGKELFVEGEHDMPYIPQDGAFVLPDDDSET